MHIIAISTRDTGMIAFSVLSIPASRCPLSRPLPGMLTRLPAKAVLSSPIHPTPTSQEPTLKNYFFKQVTPVMKKAIAEDERSHWPLIVLHFDFKDNQTASLRVVWRVLGEHEGWLSTAVKTRDPGTLSPIDREPMLVVTEEVDEQQKVFYDAVPVGARPRLFGSAHTHPTPKNIKNMTKEQLMHWAVDASPEERLNEEPTNYSAVE